MKAHWLIGLCLLVMTLIACSSPPAPVSCEPIERGVSYLEHQLNPSLGLLHESPTVQPFKYWLTNDNALAAYALTRLDKLSLANILNESIEKHGSRKNGLIEVVWGGWVDYPPGVSYYESRQPLNRNDLCASDMKPLGDVICQERHSDGAEMADWKDYADLAFMGALNEFQRGNRGQAQAVFEQTLRKFNGIGFREQGSNAEYETYKIALGIFVGGRMNVLKSDIREQLLNILLAQQDDSGGFVTHYRNASTKMQGADTNVETTSFALLALDAVACK